MLPAWFVVLMGMGTVFAGLILIIALCKILSFFFKKNQARRAPEPVSPPAPASSDAGTDRALLDAIIVSAVAELSGKPIPAVKIVSIRKVS